MSSHPVEAMFNEESIESIDFETFLEEEFGENDDLINNKNSIPEKENETEDIDSLIVMPQFDRELKNHEKIMVETIEKVDRRSWTRGEGLKTMYSILNEKLNGIQPGLGFVGGESNMGKS